PQLTALENRILSKLALYPAYSSTDLSRELEISSDTAREYIARLKSKGLLQREGARRYGSWKVTDTGLQLIGVGIDRDND
ncbi:MAG: HTH domain-containing protein, partial [Pedobacter sp.]